MTASRVLAGLVALTALAGLVMQFGVIPPGRPDLLDPVARLWGMLRYFTILTNLLVLGIFGAVALGRRPGPDWLATATLAIVMVGAIYNTLLVPEVPLTGLAARADLALHTLSPILAAAWWLGFGGHGLARQRLWVWLLWPLGYCIYGLARGQADGIYPYFFVDVGTYGWGRVLVYIVGMVVAFGLAALALWGHARLSGRAATD